mmetsp:Transcript_92321/g.202182  ORF Transcript_92321/g.202182 Transcript_92321/m.202182 type:complete len:129 (+) Transcript_92321:1226-1612(+)
MPLQHCPRVKPCVQQSGPAAAVGETWGDISSRARGRGNAAPPPPPPPRPLVIRLFVPFRLRWRRRRWGFDTALLGLRRVRDAGAESQEEDGADAPLLSGPAIPEVRQLQSSMVSVLTLAPMTVCYFEQ